VAQLVLVLADLAAQQRHQFGGDGGALGGRQRSTAWPPNTGCFAMFWSSQSSARLMIASVVS
jgi:hypothetical protein